MVVIVVVAARRAALFLAAGARLYDRELEAVGLGIRGDPNHDRVRAEPVGAEILGRCPRVDAVGARQYHLDRRVVDAAAATRQARSRAISFMTEREREY